MKSNQNLNCENISERQPLYPSVPLTRPPLRIGVMLDKLTAPAWVAAILTDIQLSHFAELEFAVINNLAQDSAVKNGKIKRLLSGEVTLSELLYRRYAFLDQKFHPQCYKPFVEQNVTQFFTEDKIISIFPQRKKYVDRFAPDDILKIKSFHLDVILRFGFNIIRGDILKCARYGVWSYHHDDNNEYRGRPDHFWEVYERNPVSGAVLQILTDELDAGKVIYRTYGMTQSMLWPSENRVNTYWKASNFVIRCLRRVYLEGAPKTELSAQKYMKRIYRVPNNRQMLPLISRLVVDGVANVFRNKFKHERWFIAYRKADASPSIIPTADGFTKIVAPENRFFADPFVIRHGDTQFILFEDFEISKKMGKISFVKIEADGTVSQPATALELGTHNSYPFTFQWDGEIYMIPETLDRNAVKLFRAVEFPTQWEFVGDLLKGVAAVDATLFEHNGYWFMFVNIAERNNSVFDELFLFVAQTPLGPWKPHPKNPIKSDSRSARPAGNIFQRNGRIIRPSQDCSGIYGRSIVFSEIALLSADHYEERFLGRIDPTWARGIIGTHHFSTDGILDVIDARQT